MEARVYLINLVFLRIAITNEVEGRAEERNEAREDDVLNPGLLLALAEDNSQRIRERLKYPVHNE